jgi:hypothetical protein
MGKHLLFVLVLGVSELAEVMGQALPAKHYAVVPLVSAPAEWFYATVLDDENRVAGFHHTSVDNFAAVWQNGVISDLGVLYFTRDEEGQPYTFTLPCCETATGIIIGMTYYSVNAVSTNRTMAGTVERHVSDGGGGWGVERIFTSDGNSTPTELDIGPYVGTAWRNGDATGFWLWVDGIDMRGDVIGAGDVTHDYIDAYGRHLIVPWQLPFASAGTLSPIFDDPQGEVIDYNDNGDVLSHNPVGYEFYINSTLISSPGRVMHATSINNQREVIGYLSSAEGDIPFLYDGSLHDVNDLLPEPYQGQIVITDVLSINNAGDLLLRGEVANSGTHILLFERSQAGKLSIADEAGNAAVMNTNGWFLSDRGFLLPVELTQTNYPISEDSTDFGSNAEKIIDNEIAYITGAPEMPKLQIQIGHGGLFGLNVKWWMTLTSERFERGTKDDVQIPSPQIGPIVLPIDQPWRIDNYYSGFVGGKATIHYVIQNTSGASLTPEQLFEFKIRGKNPKDADARTYIQATEGSYRLGWAIVQHESRQTVNGVDFIYNEFNAGGSLKELPNFSGNYPREDGWGIAQLDRPLNVSASTAEVYSWHDNLSKFYAELGQKQSFAITYVNALRSVYQRLGTWEGPPLDFVRPGTSTHLSALEAAVIVLYNGASWAVDISNGAVIYSGPPSVPKQGGTRYLSCWEFHPDNASGSKWTFHENSTNPEYLFHVIYTEFEGHETHEE